MDAVQERNYKVLRRRLTELDYTDPLGPESCSLVEALLNDVLKSVGNFETLAQRYDANVRRLHDQGEALEEARDELQRLAAENGRLRAELSRAQQQAAVESPCKDIYTQAASVRRPSPIDASDHGSLLAHRDRLEQEKAALRVALDEKTEEGAAWRKRCIQVEEELLQQRSPRERQGEARDVGVSTDAVKPRAVLSRVPQVLLACVASDQRGDQPACPRVSTGQGWNAAACGGSAAGDSAQFQPQELVRRVVVLQGKLDSMEKALRGERSRSFHLRQRVHGLEDQLEEKVKTVERLELLRRHRQTLSHYCQHATRSISNNRDGQSKEPTATQTPGFEEGNGPLSAPLPTLLIPAPSARNQLGGILPATAAKTKMATTGSSTSPISCYTPPRRTSSDDRVLIGESVSFRYQARGRSEPPCWPCSSKRSEMAQNDNRIQQLQEALEMTRHKLLSCQDALQAAVHTKDHLRQSCSLRDESAATVQSHYERELLALRNLNAQHQATVAQLEGRLVQLQCTCQNREELAGALEVQVRLLSQRIKQLISAVAESHAVEASLQKQLEERRKSYQDELSSLKQALASLTPRVALAQESERRLALEIARLQNLLSTAIGERDRFRDLLLKSQLNAEESEATEKQLESEVAELRKKLQVLGAEGTGVEGAVGALPSRGDVASELTLQQTEQQEFVTLRQEISDLSLELARSTRCAAEQDCQLQRLKDENRLLKALQKPQTAEKACGRDSPDGSAPESEKSKDASETRQRFFTDVEVQTEDSGSYAKMEKKIGALEARLSRQRRAFQTLEQLCTSLKRRVEVAVGSTASSHSSAVSFLDDGTPVWATGVVLDASKQFSDGSCRDHSTLPSVESFDTNSTPTGTPLS